MKYKGDEEAKFIQGLNENFIVGKFGQLTYTNSIDQEQKTYCAWRIEIKFGSEHNLEGVASEAEVLVYHKELMRGLVCDTANNVASRYTRKGMSLQ